MSVSPETYDNILKYGLQASYDAIQDKDSDVLYFCTDTKKIYKGTIDFTDSVVYAATRPTTGIIVGKVYLIGDLTTRSYTTEVYDGSAWHILGNATITSITSETATDSVLPTALAVKTYVDNQIGGSGVVASVAASTTSEGYLTVTDGAGAATEVGVPGVVTTPTYEASTRTFTFPVVGDNDVVVELGKDIFIDSSANNRYENGNIYLYLNDGEGTTDPTELVIPVTGLITDYIGDDTDSIQVDVDATTHHVTANAVLRPNVTTVGSEWTNALKLSSTEGAKGLYVDLTDVEADIAQLDSNLSALATAVGWGTF